MSCRFDQKVSESFRLSGYALLPGLVDRDTARGFEISTRALPARRVICGNPDLSWEEQHIPPDHAVARFFGQQGLVATLDQQFAREQFQDLSCWTCRYRKGEHIGPHKDRSGSVQIVLSLNGTGHDDDGALTLLVEGQKQTFVLHAGDAIAFRAHEITHYTSAPQCSASRADPLRVVAVARYFFGTNHHSL